MLLSSLPQELSWLLLISSSFHARRIWAGPAVNVALQASFNAPPYILELLETAAEENSTAYFPLLDRIAEGRFAECSTDQDLYNTFLQVVKDDGHITNPDALSSFQFALSIHSAAPRIEANYHYYDTSVEPSLMVAQDAACPVWVHFDGKQYCSPALDRAQQDMGPIKHSEMLPFDRVLGEDSDTVSILYADITSPLFGQFHQTISSTAHNGQTSYRIRYRPSSSPLTKPFAVNGYGIGLALKRTDYIVIDDRKAEVEIEGRESVVTPIGAEDIILENEELADLKPLSSKELLGLGLKASSFIMASDDPFKTLLKVSSDFPKHSFAMSKSNASVDFVKEHRTNRDAFLPAGYNVIWMNGQQVQTRQMDAFTLLEELRRERSTVENLRSLGFSGLEAVQILSHPATSKSKLEGDEQRYDYRDDIEGGKVIIWLNDIEKDKRYSEWPKHTSPLLQRTWPGQLPQVRRDIHNVVLPLDLTNVKDIDMLLEQLQILVRRKIPIRFGIVPLTTSANAVDQAKIVYHLLDTYGLSAVFAYLEACAQGTKSVKPHKGSFDSATSDRKLRRDKNALDFEAVFELDIEQSRVQDNQRYLERLGADEIPAPFFTNGIAMPRNDGWLQDMSVKIDADLRMIQGRVYEEVVPEDSWLPWQYLEQAAPYRNALIIPEDENSIKIINMGSILLEHGDIYDMLPHLSSSSESSDELSPHMFVVVDLDTKEGIELLTSAATFCRENQNIDLVFVHNPIALDPLYSVVLADHVDKNGPELDADMLQGAVMQMANLESAGIPQQLKEKFSQNTFDRAPNVWKKFHPLLTSLGLEPGQQVVVLNGRTVGPIPKSTQFSASDLAQLLQFERSKRLGPANAALTALSLASRIKSPLQAAILSSTIANSMKSDIPEGIFESAPTLRMNKFEVWEGSATMIQTGDPESSSVHLVASIDPTSEKAQRWIPILKVLSELNGVHLKLYLNPREKMQELPIKRFYRHVLDSKPSFDEEGGLRHLQATFDGLPKKALLSLALDVPPAWLVAPKESIHDLDNIKLSALKEGMDVDAIYELEHILIEGHSRDVTVGPPPRGVQLLLGTDKDPHFADTIIMANLGYFQFKANPGYWKIHLQEGRSSKIFSIDSAGQKGYHAQPGDESTDITLMSFQGKTLYPRLSRKPGLETEDVLEESLKSGTPMEYVSKASKFASSLLSTVGLGPSGFTHADINIFSVASGHLYERMLNIMMVSVMRHTKHTVKFWFIAQFLSPSFKASLPTLAAHYNFDYELITYKWPHWLRAQSEKQREIWGYKILFLDVLFPTSLDKVIFVDADQIVRTDMYDLVTLDLEGAPYGFTPMCDSRTSMEGFRFWKQGYWANYLRGLPYHISALYVVDLKLFRTIAAGDRLRGQYHQLSADPASLSNLDQDLPNHMQHQIKIKSLPQDWLWCETWCSDEALETARTIDLCNNPETKEPKLSRARRQVPEWTGIDEEVAGVLKAVEAEGKGKVRGGVQEVIAEGREDGGSSEVVENVQKEDEEKRIKDEL